METNEKLKALKEMLSFVREGDTVIVSDISRFLPKSKCPYKSAVILICECPKRSCTSFSPLLEDSMSDILCIFVVSLKYRKNLLYPL